MLLKPKFPLRVPKSRYRKERSTSHTIRPSTITCFRTSTIGPAKFVLSESQKGGNPFCFPENIEDQAGKLFGDLLAANYLRNLDAQAFSAKAAHFLAELNAIHAFREGNGRSQLTFFALLADHAGYSLNLDKLEPREMLDAMIASFGGDEHKLAAIIEGLIS